MSEQADLLSWAVSAVNRRKSNVDVSKSKFVRPDSLLSPLPLVPLLDEDAVETQEDSLVPPFAAGTGTRDIIKGDSCLPHHQLWLLGQLVTGTCVTHLTTNIQISPENLYLLHNNTAVLCELASHDRNLPINKQVLCTDWNCRMSEQTGLPYVEVNDWHVPDDDVLEHPQVEVMCVSAAKCILINKKELNVKTVNVIGTVCVISEIIQVKGEKLFLAQVKDDTTSEAVNVLVKTPAHLHWQKLIIPGRIYVFTHLKPTTLYKGTKKESPVYTSWTSAALYPADSFNCINLTLQDWLVQNGHDADLGSRLEPPGGTDSPSQSHLLTFAGTVTNTSQAAQGILELNHKVRLYVSHLPAVHEFNLMRCGTSIVIHNVHHRAASKNPKIHLCCCMWSCIKVKHFSEQDSSAQSYSMSRCPESQVLMRCSTSLSQWDHVLSLSCTLQDKLHTYYTRSQCRLLCYHLLTSCSVLQAACGLTYSMRDLAAEFLDATHQRCCVTQNKAIPTLRMPRLREVTKELDSNRDKIAAYVGWLSVCQRTGRLKLEDSTGAISCVIAPTSEDTHHCSSGCHFCFTNIDGPKDTAPKCETGCIVKGTCPFVQTWNLGQLVLVQKAMLKSETLIQDFSTKLETSSKGSQYLMFSMCDVVRLSAMFPMPHLGAISHTCTVKNSHSLKRKQTEEGHVHVAQDSKRQKSSSSTHSDVPGSCQGLTVPNHGTAQKSSNVQAQVAGIGDEMSKDVKKKDAQQAGSHAVSDGTSYRENKGESCIQTDHHKCMCSVTTCISQLFLLTHQDSLSLRNRRLYSYAMVCFIGDAQVHHFSPVTPDKCPRCCIRADSNATSKDVRRHPLSLTQNTMTLKQDVESSDAVPKRPVMLSFQGDCIRWYSILQPGGLYRLVIPNICDTSKLAPPMQNPLLNRQVLQESNARVCFPVSSDLLCVRTSFSRMNEPSAPLLTHLSETEWRECHQLISLLTDEHQLFTTQNVRDVLADTSPRLVSFHGIIITRSICENLENGQKGSSLCLIMKDCDTMDEMPMYANASNIILPLGLLVGTEIEVRRASVRSSRRHRLYIQHNVGSCIRVIRLPPASGVIDRCGHHGSGISPSDMATTSYKHLAELVGTSSSVVFRSVCYVQQVLRVSISNICLECGQLYVNAHCSNSVCGSDAPPRLRASASVLVDDGTSSAHVYVNGPLVGGLLSLNKLQWEKLTECTTHDLTYLRGEEESVCCTGCRFLHLLCQSVVCRPVLLYAKMSGDISNNANKPDKFLSKMELGGYALETEFPMRVALRCVMIGNVDFDEYNRHLINVTLPQAQ